MEQSHDSVWNAITNSAKGRFDYSQFEGRFLGFDPKIAENILFKIIVGHASGDLTEDIAAVIQGQLLLIGCSFPQDELSTFILDRHADLSREITAMGTAQALFDMGVQVPGVLVQTYSLLNRL